jgi:hypothetical protein
VSRVSSFFKGNKYKSVLFLDDFKALYKPWPRPSCRLKFIGQSRNGMVFRDHLCQMEKGGNSALPFLCVCVCCSCLYLCESHSPPFCPNLTQDEDVLRKYGRGHLQTHYHRCPGQQWSSWSGQIIAYEQRPWTIARALYECIFSCLASAEAWEASHLCVCGCGRMYMCQI